MKIIYDNNSFFCKEELNENKKCLRQCENCKKLPPRKRARLILHKNLNNEDEEFLKKSATEVDSFESRILNSMIAFLFSSK